MDRLRLVVAAHRFIMSGAQIIFNFGIGFEKPRKKIGLLAIPANRTSHILRCTSINGSHLVQVHLLHFFHLLHFQPLRREQISKILQAYRSPPMAVSLFMAKRNSRLAPICMSSKHTHSFPQG